MGLFKPAWQSKDREKALKAIEKENSALVLVEIAQRASYLDVRITAFNKIPDKQRVEAVKLLNDQDMLNHIMENDNNHTVSYQAMERTVERTNAPSTLVYLAKNHERSTVRSLAVERLHDKSVLADIALNDKDGIIRSNAVKKITDQLLLERIAKSDSFERVRYIATEKIENQTVLKYIASNDSSLLVREKAATMLTDKTLYEEIILEQLMELFVQNPTTTGTPRAYAINIKVKEMIDGLKKITLPEILERIAISCPENSAYGEAFANHVFQKPNYSSFYREYVSRPIGLTDSATLRRIAKQSENRAIRRIACEKSGGHQVDSNTSVCEICGIEI